MEKEISYMIHSTACMGQTGQLAGGVWEFRNTERKLWTFYGYLMFSHYIGLEMLKRVFSSVSSRSRRIGSSKFSYMRETFPNRIERFRKQLWELLYFSFKNGICNISQITPRPLFQLHMLRVPFGISQVCRIFRSVTWRVFSMSDWKVEQEPLTLFCFMRQVYGARPSPTLLPRKPPIKAFLSFLFSLHHCLFRCFVGRGLWMSDCWLWIVMICFISKVSKWLKCRKFKTVK